MQSRAPGGHAQRVPKPPRPLFEFNPFPVVARRAAHRGGDRARAADLVVVPAPAQEAARPVIVDPFAHAKAEFQRIEALGLARCGRARAVRHADDRSRARLSRGAHTRRRTLSLTSTELQRTVRALPSVPEERLTRVLTEADLIKFARRPVSTRSRARDRPRGADDRRRGAQGVAPGARQQEAAA